MAFTFKKESGKLIFDDFGGYESRNTSTIWCIREADAVYNWGDFKEIYIRTEDYERDPNEYTYSKRDSYSMLVPDFNFHSWPQVGIHDYNTLVQQIDAAGLSAYTINKVGWIGNSETNVMRRKLLEISAENTDILDCFDMRWLWSGETVLHSTRYISTPDLVSTYSILIDIEGAGYSGRLKHLLWSHRPLLLVDRPHKEFFFEYLKEWEHYIPVKNDLSDLVEKAKWCLENYEKALIIAENAFQFSKIHLTREACYKQWDKIVNKS